MKFFLDYYKEEFNLVANSNMSNQLQELIDSIKNLINLKSGIVLTAGNGGSATTAEHFATDLALTFKRIGKPLNAQSLNISNSLLTALSNDINFENVFEYQLNNWLSFNPMLVTFSASGNSKNLLNLLKFAANHKIPSFSFIGFDGGEISKISGVTKIFFPDIHKNYGHIENIHLSACHFIIEEILS